MMTEEQPVIGSRATAFHPDYGEVNAVWTKASHVPLYGWARVDQDPEDCDLLSPQPIRGTWV